MNKNIYAKKEEEILKFWSDNDIFKKSIEQKSPEAQYVFYDGPPFATGLPHYGHILSSVIKDLIPRYQTMKGMRVDRRWGWDCHGLPIETITEKKLNISGKKQIEETGIDVFNETAKGLVLNYVQDWKSTIERVGRWVDFDNSYKTMDSTYMESVWWTLKNLWDKGLIYESRKVLMYCPRCETPVSNAEIAMDNSYKDVTELSLTVKFKLKNPEKLDFPGNTYVLAWTTTPWTLPANVALAVGRDIDYSLIDYNGENIILASELISKNIKGDFELVRQLKGQDLIGLEYDPLYFIDKVSKNSNAWKIYGADFVTIEDGTGVVHVAVIYGEDDCNLGKENNLPEVPLLDSSAHFNEDSPELLQGLFYKKAQVKIIEDLRSRKVVFKEDDFDHSYPFCWRCESPLIYNAISSWFIDIQSKKQLLIDENEKINWFPGNLKHGRFLNILQTAPDWNISRNRYWATVLPFFKCTNKECHEVQCIGSVAELKEKSLNFSEVFKSSEVNEIDLHRQFVDKIELKCEKCSSKMKRIPEVIDCWVESGSMPFAQMHYPFENKEVFESKYPGQFIGEYIAQTRAWFYYMHVLGVLNFGEISFENVSVTGNILAEDGTKMSKSKGNFPNPLDIIDQYGVDALRFYLMSSVVMQAENISFNETDLREVYNKVINIIYNISNYYKIYDGEINKTDFDYNKLSLIDKWAISRLTRAVKNCTESLDRYDTVRYCREIKTIVDEVSTWWLRRSRDRFKKGGEDAEIAFSTLRYILKSISKLVAPVIPFAAENLWLSIMESEAESVHLADWEKVIEEYLDEDLESQMTYAMEIVEQGHAIRAANSLKVRQPLKSISFEKKNLSSEVIKIILEELNIEEIIDLDQINKKLSSASGAVVIEGEIDDRLKSLGNIREIVRSIQDSRKKNGMKQGELALARYSSDSKDACNFITENKDVIKEQASLQSMEEGEVTPEGSSTAKIFGTTVYIETSKK